MPTEYTTNYQLAKPDFNLFGWHDEINGNSDTLDSILFTLTGLSNFVGPWTNSTNYIEGQRVLDSDDATIWNCQVDHTSAATDTFADDRTANPTYWSTVATVPFDRGEWDNEVFYSVGDIAHSTPDGLFGVANTSHTSSASPNTMRDDIANWSILFDAQDLTLASNIGFVPSGTVVATNVQAAIDELMTETNAAISAIIAAAFTFPAGTDMVFYEATAPTGWTAVAQNNKALRVVSSGGTGGTAGGTTAFTSVFTSRTIAIGNLPAHTHGDGSYATSSDGAHTHTYTGVQTLTTATPGGTPNIDHNVTPGVATSSDGSHTHDVTGTSGSTGSGTAMDFAVQYVDVIIATKN